MTSSSCLSGDPCELCWLALGSIVSINHQDAQELMMRQVSIMSSVVGPGLTGMINRWSSCFLPPFRVQLLWDCFWFFFGWSPHILDCHQRVKPLGQRSSPLLPSYSRTHAKVHAELAHLFSNGDLSRKITVMTRNLQPGLNVPIKKKSLLYLLLPCKSVFYYCKLFLPTLWDSAPACTTSMFTRCWSSLLIF